MWKYLCLYYIILHCLMHLIDKQFEILLELVDNNVYSYCAAKIRFTHVWNGLIDSPQCVIKFNIYLDLSHPKQINTIFEILNFYSFSKPLNTFKILAWIYCLYLKSFSFLPKTHLYNLFYFHKFCPL